MANIKVSRLSTYPSENPQGFVVGFTVSTDSGRSFFIDTLVNYDEANTDEIAVKKAYEMLKNRIEEQIKSLEVNNILGKDLQEII